MQKADNKIYLFEQSPIPKAVATLAVPTVLSQLVMVLYNLADTFWVGMLNNAVQNAAVTLAAPVLLAFNAINNLFGVGSSSMMSRALGRKDYETVSRSSAFGFYCSIICGIIFSLLCTVFQNPLLVLLGADETTMQATREYMFWTVNCARHPQRRHGVPGAVGGLGDARQHRHHERMPAQHRAGPCFHPALGL